MNIPLTLSVWIHITCAVLLVGGVFFFRAILLKYAAREGGLSDELRDKLATRWLHVAGGFLLVLLVTGLYNFTQKNALWKASEGPVSPHAIFGVKFLLFLAVVVVTGLAITAKGAKASRRKTYLTINVVLGLLIVFASAVLSNSY
ncbi:MAG: hypothetical protein PWP23_3081 [Candidatus Sumerlaeota bacterium]|nr:hypothetical protein [Candidatus Sumerlaeota bacterium]